MYTIFNASQCHTTTRYERPACLTAAEAPKPAPAKASGYPEYLKRVYNGVLCETL